MATFWSNRHLHLDELKEKLARQHTSNNYIGKVNIPTYPRPELHVSNISHSTNLQGLQGIKAAGGFRSSGLQKVVWFSLTVSPDELRDAESREMMLVRSGGREQRYKPQGNPQAAAENRPNEEAEPDVLEGPPLERDSLLKFASSSAFGSSSKYGSFRFTFSLRNVLDKYKQQFCGGQEPVFRVYGTTLFSQEVMYAVLVHSPDDKKFSHLPLLEMTRNYICGFRAGPEPVFIWRSQAMSGTHGFELVMEGGNIDIRELMNHNEKEFYLWDHMTLALHVDNELLTFEDLELKENLRFCEVNKPPVRRNNHQLFGEAEAEVKKLWPDQEHLQRFDKSPFHVTA